MRTRHEAPASAGPGTPLLQVEYIDVTNPAAIRVTAITG
ncbi:hypothetical protein HD593_001805 [Nonomuraea rubra]|uniref:Uncharacterized protein n=1 Tax=Nonomuraea rubra TaxID=46180 RepID=A0A7X0NP84_9ACTN|nr:hypothetical protein [Nonomuraea rubra]